MTKILLLRHGQSKANATRVYLGHTDWDLSELGYVQAQEAAQALRDEKITAVYSSDLMRARHTAQPHAALRSLSVIPKRQLREIYIGEWEGVSLDIIESVWHDEYFIEWKEKFGTFRAPNGESVKEAGERFTAEVTSIAKENPDTTILIVAHAAVLRAFWGCVSNIPWEELADAVPFPPNASVMTVIYDADKLIPVSYSSNAHLKTKPVEMI